MSGYTTTSSLEESLDTIVSAARTTREFAGVMSKLVDVVDLEEGKGLTWNEVTLPKLTAQSITETQLLDNPQELTDSKFPVTPTVVGIELLLTDRMQKRTSKVVLAKIGQQGQEALERKKDIDLITVLDGFTSLGGAAVPITSGHIRTGRYRITSNGTAPGKPPFRCVLHGWQIKAIEDELVAGVGTYPVPEGPTAQVFKTGRMLRISDVEVYEDGNITRDSSQDAKGGVFSKEGIVLVRGRSTWKETERKQIGGGATAIFMYDEYAPVERLADGITSAWGYELYGDATTPTS